MAATEAVVLTVTCPDCDCPKQVFTVTEARRAMARHVRKMRAQGNPCITAEAEWGYAHASKAHC